ncbi:hypothetical protein CL616_00045 [archaeon]|nr:hypothetical protein [archaeon]
MTIFDSAVVDYGWYRVAFSLLNVSKKEKDEFITHLKKHKYLFWVGELGGNWDIMVNFVCKDVYFFNKLFEELIAKFGKYIREYELLIYINLRDLERNYILGKKEKKSFIHGMNYDPKVKLDDLDRDIVKELTKDALITNLDLGSKLKVSRNTIKNRIKLMIKNKLLLGFRLFIDPRVLGYSSHMLFLEINRLNLEEEKKLFNYIKAIPNVTFLVKHIGRWRVGMEIETKDEREFQDIFTDIRGRFSDIITGFESFPIFQDHLIDYFPEGVLE